MQLGLLGHVVRFAGANLRDETLGFWLEVRMYISIIDCSHDWGCYICAYILSLSSIPYHMYIIRHPLYICLTLDS